MIADRTGRAVFFLAARANAEAYVVRSSWRNVVERTDYQWRFVVWLRGRTPRPTKNIPFRPRTAQPQ
jgi:hypothetical protein